MLGQAAAGEKKKRRRIFGKPLTKTVGQAVTSQTAPPSSVTPSSVAAEVERLRALLDKQKRDHEDVIAGVRRARVSLESRLLATTTKKEAIEEELKNRHEQLVRMTQNGNQNVTVRHEPFCSHAHWPGEQLRLLPLCAAHLMQLMMYRNVLCSHI